MRTVLVPIHQNLPDRRLSDIPATVLGELCSSGIADPVPANARIAIGVGSRGISQIDVIVRTVVDFWRSHGMRPFIFPAMGSHGGGTPEGQASVLAHYGVDERSMGCPVISSFDVVSLGRSELGVECFVSRDAWASDGVFLVGRIKWHTSFAGALESGIAKMTAIGLGKLEGARSSHAHARRHGMEAVIRSVAGHTLSTGRVLGGLGILEDAHHHTAEVAVLKSATLMAEEERLLARTKSWMARIPAAAVYVLIIDEIGKNIAGTGMDLKVVNRGVQGQYNPWPEPPTVERIFLRDLSDLSYGNAVGVGLADVAHDRLIRKIDVNAGRVNAVTSGSLAAVRTPLHFPSDRECLELAMSTVGKFEKSEITAVWIRNTLELGAMAVTENLADELRRNPGVAIDGRRFDFDFDSHGNLSPFAG